MKITLDLKDDLLIRAKKLAKKNGKPLRAVVEDSLRVTLEVAEEPARYQLPDMSVGDPDSDDPLGNFSWQDLRTEIYGGPEEK